MSKMVQYSLKQEVCEMSKIICDICGTTYPSSAESCPICGFSNESVEEFADNDMNMEEIVEEPRKKGLFSASSKKKEIFDYDEVNADDEYADDDEDDEDYDEQEEEEEAPAHNTFVVILLTVLIVVLLGAAAFIFFRFFLPNMSDKNLPVETTAAYMEETEAPVTEASVPCQQMVMTNAGVAELNAEGQQFLLHVKALPENTTDKIIYTSDNESIATVTEDGKITAVSEGETLIHINCGEYYIGCPVIVKYVEETVPPTTEAVVEETVAETEAVEPDSEEQAPAEETEAAAEAPTVNSNVTLKLKKTDIRLGVYYEFQLELDCDLNPEDVEWSSEHEYIAKVDDKGNVTAVKEGTTSIIAKYGDQQASCIVRCGWY